MAIALRASVEATHYTSPDSRFYFWVAENMKAGNGLSSPDYTGYPFDSGSRLYIFSTWPAGYPAFIALVAWIGQISPLVASKVVNMFFLGLLFALFYRWWGKEAWFPALYFFSYGKLEVYSYTWSEGPFLFFVFWLAFLVAKDSPARQDAGLFLKLSLALMALFMLRYAGLIYFFFVFLFFMHHIQQKYYAKAGHYFVAMLAASLFVLGYFYLNKLHTGHYTGMNRIYPEKESWLTYGFYLLTGLANELSLARNYFHRGYTDWLYGGLMALQGGLFWYLYRERRLLRDCFKRPEVRVLLGMAFFYLAFTMVLRKIQPFDPFNYRILAPFSTPIYVSLMAAVATAESKTYFHKIKPWVLAFMLVSLLMNLPKQFLLNILLGGTGGQ
ncbi:MAG: hypothetical protein OHK0053_00180 [Microscillaceae bacterium]